MLVYFLVLETNDTNDLQIELNTISSSSLQGVGRLLSLVKEDLIKFF